MAVQEFASAEVYKARFQLERSGGCRHEEMGCGEAQGMKRVAEYSGIFIRNSRSCPIARRMAGIG